MPDRDRIYCVATVRHGGESRTVGYFFHRDDATYVVETNSCDIYENGYYPYAVIEEVLPGVYPIHPDHWNDSSHQMWYRWRSFNEDVPGYKLTEKPKQFSKIICWTMG